MRGETFLPVLLISCLIPLSSCSISITTLTSDAWPGEAPRIYIQWKDSESGNTYVITVRRESTVIPNGDSSPLQNKTDKLEIVFEGLKIDAKYRVRIETVNGNSLVGQLIETPKFLTPLVSNNEIHVSMEGNPKADNTALIGYKLTNSNQEKAQFPDPRTGDVILLLYSNNTNFTAKVQIGTNETSGPNNTYKNIRLDTGVKYAFTQRFEINGTVFYFPWSDPIIAPGTTGTTDGLTSTELVGIIVGITAAIVGLVFIIVCILNWKYSLRYRPKPTKAKPVEKLVTDPGIPVCEDDFFDHLCQMKLHNFKGFYEEFSSMKKDEFQSSEAFRDPDNQHKNRFVNIPCYDDTRVHLVGSTNVDTYIHANYVPGAHNDKEYIYSQSPLPETIYDFWTMVWEQRCDTIVMIGQLIEKGKQDCASYFPDDDDVDFDSFEIRLTSRHATTDYIIRTFLLCKDGKERKITHYQYHGWPTNKMTPEYPTSFLRMLLRISKSIPDRPGKPIVVHGTNDRHGRAGIYICIDAQIQRFLLTADLSVFGHAVTCKKHRHDGVKTLDEYIFIHDSISEAVLLKSVDSITVDGLPKYIEDASKGDDEGRDVFLTEFDFLTSAPMLSTQKMAVGSQACNATKNRYSTIKPYDYNRVKLKQLKNQEGSDYINASYINTYKRKRPFIAAQAPLVETIADFWRMIYENKSWVIVMLGQEIEGGQLKANRFWPEEGHAMKLDDLTVKFISITRDNISDVWIRQMELMDEKGERELIQFYQYQEWPSQKAINSQNIRSLIQLVNQSESWKQKLNAQFVTVVSSSGIGRPGVLMALAALQEEADGESSVDVFRAVRQLNQQRASLVQTKEEYSLIYTATLEITENARRRPVIQEQLTIDDDDVGSTLGINLKRNTSPSIMPSTSISEKPADIIEPAQKESTRVRAGVKFDKPADIIEPAQKESTRERPGVKFDKPADIIEPAQKESTRERGVKFDKPADIIEPAQKESTRERPGVKFQMADDETDKKVLGRMNTQSHESKM